MSTFLQTPKIFNFNFLFYEFVSFNFLFFFILKENIF
jgi:hypothetical protein